jgi:hypothetical protein
MKRPTGTELASWRRQFDRQITETIASCGCFIQGVLGEGRTPSFAYTVGLYELGHPELITYGLDSQSAWGVLNWFFERIRDGGELRPGQIVQPPGSDTRFLVEDFPAAGTVLHTVNLHYHRDRWNPVRAYQLTWDADGSFPWEPGYPCAAWLQPRPRSSQGATGRDHLTRAAFTDQVLQAPMVLPSRPRRPQ